MGRRVKIILVPVVISVLAGALFFTARFETDGEGEPAGGEEMTSEDLDRLRALPYINIVEEESAPEKRDVTVYRQGAAYDGLNLYISLHESEAFLLDMEGTVVHRWTMVEGMPRGLWVYAETDREGRLFLLLRREGLVRLSRDSSEVKVIARGNYHHDFSFADNGDIYILSKKKEWMPHGEGRIPIFNNSVAHLAPDGSIKKEISFYDLFGDRIPVKVKDKIAARVKEMRKKRKRRGRGRFYDIFHSNTVEVVQRDLPFARKGDLIVCLRNLNLIAVIDPVEEKVRWSWGADHLDRPHQPTILDSGSILIYDNGKYRDHSRIIEYDPVKERIVWEYKADPPTEFHSRTRGANQRFPNGNTLVTESTKGRVFEITREGEIVWEFWNPFFTLEKNRRGTIYRMIRIEKNQWKED